MISECIIVGSGKFAFSCARISKKYCNNVRIFEYRPNDNISNLEKLCSKNGEIDYGILQNDSLYEYIKSKKKDKRKILLVSAFNTYIFDERFFDFAEDLIIINYHPALLPCHPGRNSEAWAIFEQDKVTGITWHIVQREVDKGNILVQSNIMLDDSYTSLRLMLEQNKLGLIEYEKMLPHLLSGEIVSYKQNEERGTYHKAKDIPNHGYIDLNWSEEKIWAFLRAMDYGKLDILGRPKIRIDSDTYIWESYEFVKDKEAMLIGENDHLISNQILLRNVREYSDE